ncbi:MAG: dockerin type I domain-containing protein [Euryarchaeota archaeon]|nr:dockerin type I domain-containing protein [Euryarchaeota archaeon]
MDEYDQICESRMASRTESCTRTLIAITLAAAAMLACMGAAAISTVDDDAGADLASMLVNRASTPAIKFTYVPAYGSFDDLKGQVWNVTPADYKVAVYIYVSGWWTKPTFAEPLTSVQGDGNWRCDITTGGVDQYATRIKAYLVPDGYTPPKMDGTQTLPEELDQNSVASVEVIRKEERHIRFSGYNWTVKSSEILVGPGPNYFSDSNQSVWVDEEGKLHLKILKKDGKWYCAEVCTTESLGYGKYIFYAASRVDRLDKNVVAGLFTWDGEAPEYNYREIDIEFSRWGQEMNDNAQYVVQPWDPPENMHRFNMVLNGNYSTHSFDWSTDSIFFQSLDGHYSSPPSDSYMIESWNYTDSGIPPDGGGNARINLWLNDADGDGIGDLPSDGQEAEIIIRRFEHITPIDTPHPMLKDDAYHYSPDSINDHLYTEWWYFNVYNNDRQFMVSYFLTDPANLTGLGDAEVLAVVYDEMPLIGFTSTPVSDFTADYEKPDVTIGSNTLLALNNTTFVINGSYYDVYTNIPIRWNLTYTLDVGSWFGTPAPVHVGHVPDDWMQWLCYMTGANVAGTITIGGTTHNMSGRGYHDHNWGEWLFDDPQWNWAQVSAPEENVSLILGDAIAPPTRNTMMAFKRNGTTITFADIDLSYTGYGFDPITSKMYPDEYHVTGNSGEYSLNVTISVIKNVPLVRPFPGALPEYVIFEQVSDYNITLFENYKPVYSLNQGGFSEYTTHKIHTVYGRVLNGGGALATVTNARTGESKQSVVASGYYSVDGDFLDYLANDTSPWVADGDIVLIEAVKDQNRGNTTLIVDMRMDKQQATDITLQPMPRKGDLNRDGEITPADAAIALKLAASGEHDSAADVSGDDRITSLDALLVLQAAAGRLEL